jgi:transglutaminase-like putative cysteine protease
MKRCFWMWTVVLGLAAGLFAQTVPEQPKPRKMPYEQANAVIKFDSTMVNLEASGRSTTVKHYQTALLTDRAIRENSEDVTVYNLGYDTVEILYARVHLPSGKTVDVGEDAIKDVPMPAFGKFYLQNVREKIITFPQLEQGAEIEVAYRQTTREVPMEGQFDLTEGYESDDPIQQKYVEIVAPASIKLKWKSRGGDIPYVTTPTGDKVKHVWSLSNIAQLVPEPGMPPAPEVYKMLLVTTVPDWQTWSRWYDALSEPEMVADDSVKQVVQDLTAGKKTSEEKINSIFYFVSNHVRYVETALTGRKAGYKPEPAAVTLRNKYGVCRDKAALMVTMLREAGVPADITLMNPSWKIDGDIPVDQFNHAIVAAYDGGRTIYVDPTVEKTKDYLAANEQDRGVLVCNKKGVDLAWTPVESSEQNLYQIQADSRLNENGEFQSQVIITTHGFADLVFRNMLQNMPPERRTNTFKQMIQRIHPTAELDTIIFGDPLDFTKTMSINLKFHATGYSVVAGTYLLFQVPGQADGLDMLTRILLRGSDLTKRRFDMRLMSTFAVRVEENVSYPKGYKVRSLPESIDMKYEGFRMARRCESTKDVVKVSRVVDFSTLTVPLNRYDKLQDMLRKSETLSRGQVVLVKS